MNDVKINYSVNDNNISMPMVRVMLGHKKYLTTVMALVDSGSPISLIPKYLADIIGIRPTNKIDTMGSPGGNFHSNACKINRIALIKNQVVLNEFVNPTIRVPLIDNMRFAILGRDIIFKKYKIRFEENDQQFWLIQ